MRKNNAIYTLTIIIIVVSTFVSLMGLLSNGGPGAYDFTAITGELVPIYGFGIYHNDSLSVASQGIASDFVTLLIAIPLLILSLFLWHKNQFKGAILLTGTIGYFLYTYTSYVFLWTYNPLFILYVVLMSCSLFSFIILMMLFDYPNIHTYFKPKFSTRLYVIYQVLIGLFLSLLWLGKIAPTLFSNQNPVGLEHYTTLVIQGMDLGFIVPTAFVSAYLLHKKHTMGYVLTAVILVKGFTMLLAINGMMINMALNGVPLEIVSSSIFGLFAVVSVYIFVKMLSQIKVTA